MVRGKRRIGAHVDIVIANLPGGPKLPDLGNVMMARGKRLQVVVKRLDHPPSLCLNHLSRCKLLRYLPFIVSIFLSQEPLPRTLHTCHYLLCT